MIRQNLNLIFLLLIPTKRKADHFEAVFKIKAKQLFQKIEEMKLKNEPTFSLHLFETYPDKIEEVIPDYINLSASFMMPQGQKKN